MTRIDLPVLRGAVTAGGPSAMSSITALAPAGGPQSAIAPAKYADRTDRGTYVYGSRFIDGAARRTVLIDSSQSQTNRIEALLHSAILDGNPVLNRIPRIQVTYAWGGETETYTDFTLPHRAYDAHIRAGSVRGVPTTEHPAYRAARDSTPLDASALMALSPISLLFGSWDASRRSRQGRWASAVTGEIIGVLADQTGTQEPLKGGARVDPVGMQTLLDGPTLIALADAQRDELSPATYKKITDAAKKLKDGQTESASALGFGGIPPTLQQLGGVSCETIIRSRVLSFATLRQLRFGSDARGDAACRAALAALAIAGIVRADSELYLRAHCHLVEDGAPLTQIDRRNGRREDVSLPSIEEADELLEEAITEAVETAGLDWTGQVFEVTGNSAVLAGREDETRDDDAAAK